MYYRDRYNDHEKAYVQFKKAIAYVETHPQQLGLFFNPYMELAHMCETNGKPAEAEPLYQHVAEKTKDDSLLFHSKLLLPYVYESHTDTDAWRKKFSDNVDALFNRGISIPDPYAMRGVPQYYLSYHGRNDVEILTRLARLFRKSLDANVSGFKAAHIANYKPPSKDKQIRIGFLSYWFRDHSVSKMAMGLFQFLKDSRLPHR